MLGSIHSEDTPHFRLPCSIEMLSSILKQVKASFTSSTPLSRKRLAPDCLRGQQEDVFSRIHHCEGSQVI
uniref:Uncharacterized protein n=1 Tax=Anguilla anguilla TaxID=7936 RepID=A0A0E9Q5F1_ANGAN